MKYHNKLLNYNKFEELLIIKYDSNSELYNLIPLNGKYKPGNIYNNWKENYITSWLSSSLYSISNYSKLLRKLYDIS